MNVEHSSVNGSIKINERGYQKLPTDQEMYVIESKKSPVEKTKRALIWRVKRHLQGSTGCSSLLCQSNPSDEFL